MNLESSALRVSTIEPGLAHLVLDMPNKSANVFTDALLNDLSGVIAEWERTPPSMGVVISSAKPGIYIAGADIVAIQKTLDWNRQQIIEFCRRGQSLFDRLANLPFPVVAAIHGVCVGGGLEFALACDARVVSRDRKTLLGLPEVKLGLIPGWGGTVRLPRLIGLKSAIELTTTGRLISAESSLELGLADELVEPDALINTAAVWVRRFRTSDPPKPLRDNRRHAAVDADQAADLESKFERAIESNRDLHPQAPLVVLRHLIDSANDPLDEACAKEAAAMACVYGSDPSAGLIEAFFLNERAKKFGRFAGIAPTAIESVGIAGAGVMGGDIARLCTNHASIAIYDVDAARADAVVQWCNARSGGAPSAFVANEIELLADCDLVIESIVEDAAIKRPLLAAIESCLGPRAILSSNTSVIRIDELAESLRHPDRFCGLHFCYPAEKRRLVEVVRGEKTSAETLADACAWIRSLGKLPLPVADSPGFIINRLLCPMFNEASHLLTQGCSISSVELAVQDFGFAMGPFEFMDAIGLDTLCAAGSYLIPRLTTPTEPSLLLHAMNKSGWKGRKSGLGFYSYASPDSPRQPNEQLDARIAQYRRGSAEPLNAEEIVRRLLMVMVNQAADALAENVVGGSDEIDLAMIHGAGFPDHRGGLLFWARRLGLAALTSEMRRWASEPGGARRYSISANLSSLALIE